MISVSNAIKTAYKEFDREITAYGYLYFKERRMSNNLLNTDNYTSMNNFEYTGNDINYIRGNHQEFVQLTTETATQIGYKLYNGTTLVDNGESLPINSNEIIFNITNNNCNRIKVYLNTLDEAYVIFNIPSSIGSTDKFTLGLTMSKNKGFIHDNIEHLSFYHIYIAKGHNRKYEPYNEEVAGLVYKNNEIDRFELSQSNNTQILSFNLDEKTDVYYTSLPYNTLDVEVNNENGYFVDYDENSITGRLNSDCYIELYLQINNVGNTFKLITMNFDEISYSDYTKAKLSFKSCLSYIKNLKLKDKFKDFNDTSAPEYLWDREYLRGYLADNYNIKLTYPQDAITGDLLNNTKMTSVQDMILNCGTHLQDLGGANPEPNINKAVLTTNNSNDEIALRNFNFIPEEYISKDYELEKPILKRENSYDRLKYTYNYVPNPRNIYEQTTETYTKTITGTLSSTTETIVLIDYDYKLDDIATSDLTTNTGITALVVSPHYNSFTLLITISGNVGKEYEITITKANVYKAKNKDIRQIDIGNKSETAKTLEINENSPLYNDYFKVVLYDNKLLSYAEIKLMALPYLEIGDTIAVEIDNAYITMTISEMNLSYGAGLIQTIKGYRLGWLYPSNEIYPSDDLYPNMPDTNVVN